MQYKKCNPSKSTLVHFDNCMYLCKCHLSEYKEHFYYSAKFPHGPRQSIFPWTSPQVTTTISFDCSRISYQCFIQDVLFHFRFPSLRLVPLGLIYIVVCIGNLFLLLPSSALLYGYVTICLSIHLQVHLVVSSLGLL